MAKLMTAEEAVKAYIKDGMTIATNGFVGGSTARGHDESDSEIIPWKKVHQETLLLYTQLDRAAVQTLKVMW